MNFYRPAEETRDDLHSTIFQHREILGTDFDWREILDTPIQLGSDLIIEVIITKELRNHLPLIFPI